ncbi:MCP four helix bundle domain-containing protein [Thioflexithrix psekupsensis]|uniref:Chemotaxis methyl-accepting receptor HlyB-like 4HB MCP domain-containing protein n=1 Tax=Thioflexithrix psekupsensis TaxID=1570016 RepID=A0A251X7F7_9GAMM|nr:MCP four helix bundle domain-containing protein [Thioflexithrix psekupsensis]OUD13926.1 hypothetical protein TPSD3_06165 [Thioflexithrix psekupsensis]
MQSAATLIKIRLAFLGIIALFIMVSIFSYNRMFVLNQKSTEMETNWLPSIVRINAIAAKISDYRMAELLHVLSLVPEEIAQQEKDIERIMRELSSLKQEYQALISSDNELKIYQNTLEKHEEYFRASQEALDYSKRNQKEEATKQLRKSSILFNSLQIELQKLVQLNQEGGEKTSRGGDEIFAQVKTMLVAINIVVALILFIFMLLIEGWSSRIANEAQFDAQDAEKAAASFINRITIKGKLRFAFLGLSVLFIIFTALSLNRMNLINQKSTEIYQN